MTFFTNKTDHFPSKSMQQPGRSLCRDTRARLLRFMTGHLSPQADWVQNHIAACPKCQRRLAAFGKVNLAMSVLKSQPHNLDLLKRANSQTLKFLDRSLREAPKAARLKTALPQPKLREKYASYRYSAANIAACIAIICLTKVGVFSSMERLQMRGGQIVKEYYAHQAGQDLADELFKT